MQKLFYAWLSLKNGGCTDNSQRWRDKVRNICKTVWSSLPPSGRLCLVFAIILCASSIVWILLPAYRNRIFYVNSGSLFLVCVTSFPFLKSTRKIMLTKMNVGEYDRHAESVAKLLLDNGVCSLQDFDAVIAWCDELIGQRRERLSRFTGGAMAVLTFCLGVFTDAVSDRPALYTLQLTIVIALLVFGVVVADVPAALFYIVDDIMPTSLTALQHFKADLLESKPQLMKLIQRRDKTDPVRRFY